MIDPRNMQAAPGALEALRGDIPVDRVDLVGAQLANVLMRAVVASGAIRGGNEEDLVLSVRIMREELKAFVDPQSGRYADERAVAKMPGPGAQLAFSALVAECVVRILRERKL